MRVIGGTAGSIPLVTPAGRNTRPTTDRIKETLFNMLSPYIQGCRFLDLFSGSGAIGIEALSRGAASAVFVDSGREAVRCIEANLAKTHLQENARISFTLFDSLRLDPADEKAGEPVTLHSRDMLAAGSMSNGSSWHAQALGKKGEVREEADIVFYCSGDIPSLYINTATGSLDAVDSDQSVREKCSYRVCAADGSGNTAGECEIHGRGNSSWKEDSSTTATSEGCMVSTIGSSALPILPPLCTV